MSSSIRDGDSSNSQMSLDEAVEQNSPVFREGSSKPGDEPESIDDASTITTVETTSGFDDIGLPQNGSWEWESVLEKRYCFDYGKHEFLMQYTCQWMRPSDFGSPRAWDVLEEKFKAYQKSPWKVISRIQKLPVQHTRTILLIRDAGEVTESRQYSVVTCKHHVM
jgi:hypothetical protein